MQRTKKQWFCTRTLIYREIKQFASVRRVAVMEIVCEYKKKKKKKEKKKKNQRRDSRELCPFAAFFSHKKGTSLWFLRAITDLFFVLVQEDFYVISLVCFRRGPYCQKCFQGCIQKVTIRRALLRSRSKRISSVCCCCLVSLFCLFRWQSFAR